MNYEGHRYAGIYPMIADAEFAELVSDIRDNDLREDIWLYEGKILDGRNRYRACLEAGVTPRFREFTGANSDALAFVQSLNRHRRHLTPGQASLSGLKYLAFQEELGRERKSQAAAEARARQEAEWRPSKPQVNASQDVARWPHPAKPSPAVSAPPRAPLSADHVAKAVGTSARSIRRAKLLTETADPALVEKVWSGELELGRAERILRDRDAELRRVEEARAAAAAAPITARVDVRHGDFREVLADLRDVDAIITDPPYPHEYLPLLDDLAAWSDKVLTPDGVLVILFGQTYLPEVYRRLDGHRPYRWTGCYLTPGSGYVSMARHVQSNWKPLLVYGGGPRFADTLSTEGSDAGAKSLHKWGQDYAAFHTLIERFTKPGQTVVDPFAGSGTTLLAAKALGRHAIGSELDPDHVRTARERVA